MSIGGNSIDLNHHSYPSYRVAPCLTAESSDLSGIGGCHEVNILEAYITMYPVLTMTGYLITLNDITLKNTDASKHHCFQSSSTSTVTSRFT